VYRNIPWGANRFANQAEIHRVEREIGCAPLMDTQVGQLPQAQCDAECHRADDFRGYGQSRGPGQSDPLSAPLHFDVLAAVRYLRKTGAKTVSVGGGSMGGGAAGDASIEAEPGEIDRLVFLGSGGSDRPEKMKARKLFLIARDDLGPSDIPRLPKVREHFEKTPGPKELIILEGSAHAQFLFATDQGERVMREILRFLGSVETLEV
jgi:pimeloyl-ACP methyl ester carboxylesterase